MSELNNETTAAPVKAKRAPKPPVIDVTTVVEISAVVKDTDGGSLGVITSENGVMVFDAQPDVNPTADQYVAIGKQISKLQKQADKLA